MAEDQDTMDSVLFCLPTKLKPIVNLPRSVSMQKKPKKIILILVCGSLMKSEDVPGAPGAGGTGGCELPHEAAGNRAWAFCKSTRSFTQVLSHLPSPRNCLF